MPQRTDRIKTLAAGSRFRVGPILVHPERLAIERDGVEISLEPRIMELLVALAEHAGEVIGAEQLLIEVWRGTFYGDNPVHRAIGVLRRQLGDDLRNPVFIETIRKRGYRLIAPVAFPEDYRRSAFQADGWAGRNPYLGLAAYDAEHSEVFFGRSRLTADVLGALQRQRDTEHRFLMLVGASGCGKTSLLRASVLPLLEQSGGFDGLHALAVAHCDFAATIDGDPMQPLAAALATWQLDGRPVFAPQPIEALAERLAASPEHVAETLNDAWHKRAVRNDSPHAHLLLLVDHAEALVASDRIDDTQRRRAWAVIEAVCAHARGGTLMVVRGDFHAALIAALPEIAERKGSDGHIDATPPRAGEIAQIVRMPAYLAGLTFEEDPNTGARLDDVLRDAAADKPDSLPLLQYTLHALYEQRREDGLLTFEAYRNMGELEGAVAHRAEAVFAELPDEVRAQLGHVLAQLIVMQSESDSVSARRAPRSTLKNDAAHALVDVFVKGRLFVGGQVADNPDFGVAHEALLRQWPRAREWAQDNRRLLHAKARMQRAAARWVEEGRSADHLLNPGRPLQEAREAARVLPDDLSADEQAFISASARQYLRRRRLRMTGIVGLAVSAVISAVFGMVALQARNEAEQARVDAERRREESLQLTDFMLVQLADKLRPTGDLKLLGDIAERALALSEGLPISQMSIDELINRSRALRTAGEVMMAEGKLSRAELAFLRANEVAREAAAKAPTLVKAQAELSLTLYWLGLYYFRQKKLQDAQRYWLNDLEANERLVRMEPGNAYRRLELSNAFNNLGGVARDKGQLGEAKTLFIRSAEIKSTLLAADPQNDALRIDLIDTHTWISSADESEGRLQDAASGYAKQISMLRALVAKRPDALLWERRLATLLWSSGRLAFSMGNLDVAHSQIEESISRLSKLIALEPQNMIWRRDLASAHIEASEIARIREDKVESIAQASAAQKLIHDVMTSTEASLALRRMDAQCRLLIARHRHGAAGIDAEWDGAIRELERVVDESNQGLYETTVLSNALIARGKYRAGIGREIEAASDWEQAIDRVKVWKKNSNILDVVVPRVHAHLLLDRHPDVEREIVWLDSIGYRTPDVMVAVTELRSRSPASQP